jgi:hypothetical protein
VDGGLPYAEVVANSGGQGGRAHELPMCDAEVVEGHAYALCAGSVRLVRRLFFSKKMFNEC